MTRAVGRRYEIVVAPDPLITKNGQGQEQPLFAF